jgi:Membrane-associated sensor, integral membrane domain/Membrane-associated sensor domain
MSARPESDSAATWLVNQPPTPLQSRMALAIAAALLVGSVITALFADTPLPRIDAFIPAMEVAVIVTDFIAAVLLFSQSWIYHSRALLVLASGYLFTALIVLLHMLTFPGAFSPTGLLDAGLQSAGWLYTFWHAGLPITLLIYAFLKDEKPTEPGTQPLTPFSVSWSVTIVVCLVCVLTWLATAEERFLPRLLLDGTHFTPLASYLLTLEALVCVMALAMLWGKPRSVLDEWLMVVIIAAMSELIINGIFISARFTLGWYVGRLFSIFTSTIVLVFFLAETARLYGRLARSNAMLLREQNNRLTTLEAFALSTSHEVRQPLTGIVARGDALLRFLGGTPPKLDKYAQPGKR